MPIRILFIDAKNTSKRIETQLSSLGLGYLVSSVRQRFGPDAAEFKIISQDIEGQLDSFKPHLVGISAVSQNYCRAIAYASAAKQRDIPVICGGIHISMLPNSLDESMMVGVLGEGEETFCELFDLFRKHGRFKQSELNQVLGIVFRGKDGKLIKTSSRPQLRCLDNIPFPARDLLEVRPHTHIFTSRGCPFRCVFCASSRFWKSVRLFSAEYVATEIEHLVEQYGVTRINFFDDLFTCDIQRIRRLKDLLQQRGILGKIRFGGAIRAELVNDETMSLLRELGVEGLGLGLESGNDTTLQYLKGAGASVAKNERAVAIVKRHGIKVFGSFVIGSPLEEKEGILDTLRLIQRTALDDFAVYVLTPYPGTPLWDYAKRRKLVSESMDWGVLNVNFEDNFDSAIVLSEKLSRKDIKELYDRFKRYNARNRFYKIIKQVISEPWKIPGYFLTRLKLGSQ